MQKEQIVGLAVRLFAIFLVVYTLRHVSGLLPYAGESSPNNVSFLFIGLFTICPLLAAALLWFFPLTVAAKLLPPAATSTPPPTAALENKGAEDVAWYFSLMGLWVLTTAIPDIFYWVTITYHIEDAAFSSQNKGNMAATLSQLILGFWLLFGSRGWVGIIRRIRTGN